MNFIQHPTNNCVLGAPRGMSREECRAMPVTLVQYQDGQRGTMSFWKPTEAERRAINLGRPVVLTMLGSVCPPVIVGVEGVES